MNAQEFLTCPSSESLSTIKWQDFHKVATEQPGVYDFCSQTEMYKDIYYACLLLMLFLLTYFLNPLPTVSPFVTLALFQCLPAIQFLVAYSKAPKTGWWEGLIMRLM